MDADPIGVSDDEFGALIASLADELIGSADNMHMLELHPYRYAEVRTSVEQIAVLTFPLCDTQGSHVKDLIVSLPALEFEHSNGSITAT